MKIKVGMKIFMLNDYDKKTLIEEEIIKVGRKYFYTGDKWYNKYDIETMRSADHRRTEVFLSEQELFDNKEAERLRNDISKLIRHTRTLDNLNLEQLRRIRDILKE